MNYTGKIELIEKLNEFGITRYEIREDMSVVINENVDWSHRNLTKLPFDIYSIDGYLDLTGNHFKTLIGFPTIIYGDLIMNNNDLYDLGGCPIVSNIYIDNNNLISLEGIGEIRGTVISVTDNRLFNIDHIKKDFRGTIYVNNNLLEDLTDKISIRFIHFKNNPIKIEKLDSYYRKLFNEDQDTIKTYYDDISEGLKEEYKWYFEGGAMGFLNVK